MFLGGWMTGGYPPQNAPKATYTQIGDTISQWFPNVRGGISRSNWEEPIGLRARLASSEIRGGEPWYGVRKHWEVMSWIIIRGDPVFSIVYSADCSL